MTSATIKLGVSHQELKSACGLYNVVTRAEKIHKSFLPPVVEKSYILKQLLPCL